ncbi:replication-relaxation family protein [Streptomyces cynarae]|uniref:replication-relaxation family protein n=1 Tax=Streptomyces cynarae TaxID=2981134 RepID=UPI00406C9237
MELTTRDLDILRLVDTFTQVSSTHIAELLFSDRSHSVPDKVLGRLVRTGYLSRVGRRASGEKGGAGAFAYQLGRYGRVLLDVEGRPSPNVNAHALMIADTYLELRRAEKAGVLVLDAWEVERRIPPVRADLFAAVEYPGQGRKSSYFLEIDLATERPVRIREKLDGYWSAAMGWNDEYFPYVVFVVNHLGRAAELQRLVRGLPEERREMVHVVMFGELIPRLLEL